MAGHRPGGHAGTDANDVALLEAMAAGACEIGVANHYYLARTLEENPDLKVDLFWASQEGAGTHVNISGAGVVEGLGHLAVGQATDEADDGPGEGGAEEITKHALDATHPGRRDRPAGVNRSVDPAGRGEPVRRG